MHFQAKVKHYTLNAVFGFALPVVSVLCKDTCYTGNIAVYML